MTIDMDSWESVTLGDLGKWVTGSTPSSSDPANKGEDVLFVTPGDIGYGGKLGGVARRISNTGADRVRRIRPGSVILVCIGTIGKVAWTDLEITTNQQINVLEVDEEKYDIRFVHWLLLSPMLQEQLWANSTSTTVALLNKKTLEKIPVQVPRLQEQKRIVETLDSLFTSVELANEELGKAERNSAILKRSILNNLLSPDENTIQGTNEVWEVKRLGDVALVTMGQSPPGSTYNKSGNGSPFFQGKTEFGDRHPTIRQWTTAGKKFARPGDILMSVRAPVGPTNIADVDCAIGRGLASIRANDSVDQRYLIWFLKHIEITIQARGKGTTFEAISGEEIRETLISLPTLETQKLIVQRLDLALENLFGVSENLKSQRSKLGQLKRSLLHKAFTGQLAKEN